MKKFAIIRGLQGSGKSSLIERYDLNGHRLSADEMRKAYAGYVLNENGALIINQEDGKQIWERVWISFQERVARGEAIILDAVLSQIKSYRRFVDHAKDAGYEIAIVDMFALDPKICKKRNARRPDATYVQETSIDRMYRQYAPHPKSDHKISHHIDGIKDPEGLERFFTAKPVDLSKYKKIVHIGDIQGVFEAMFQKGSPLPRKLSDDAFYIFVGDALDRGIENGEVLDWILNEVSPRIGKNAVWIEGNHEKHLRDMIEGNEIVSQEFENRTRPQIIEYRDKNGQCFQNKEIREFLEKMVQYFYYTHSNETVIVTHGGLPALKVPVELIPASQAMRGPGNYNSEVDRKFHEWSEEYENKTGKIIRQVHGHRNPKMIATDEYTRSYNLEGGAEIGGHIRMAVKKNTGWSTYDLRNNKFNHPKRVQEINKEESREPFGPVMPIPEWIKRGEGAEKISQETLEMFRAHKNVQIRTQKSRPYIDTIAFTKQAFYDKDWDGITNRARGLFVNNKTREITARSWDKFFNLDERPETKLENILKNYKAPYTASLKENGSLALAGWDEETQSIIFSSKGSMDNDFSEKFKEIAYKKLGAAGIERLTRAVRDLGGTATFEMIAPQFDPHIIEYAEDNLIMLDFIRRSETFEKISHEDLVQLGKYIGVEVRKIWMKADNPKALEAIIKRTITEGGWHGKRDYIEGLVIEDSAGNFVKIKAHYYGKWKNARGLVERLNIQRKRNQPVDLKISDNHELKDFMTWVEALPYEDAKLPIITLRNMFEKSDPLNFEKLAKDNEERIKKEERELIINRKVEGFYKGAKTIIKQMEKGKANPETVSKMIKRIEEDDDLNKAYGGSGGILSKMRNYKGLKK